MLLRRTCSEIEVSCTDIAFGRESLDGYAAHVRRIQPPAGQNSRPKPLYGHETGELLLGCTYIAFGRELRETSDAKRAGMAFGRELVVLVDSGMCGYGPRVQGACLVPTSYLLYGKAG